MTGDELRQLRRERLDLSQARLAERLGVTVTTVARWERGERSIAEPIARLIQLLVQAAPKTAKPKRKGR